MQNGLAIANLRVKNGLSQKEMATLINVGMTNYKLYEQNLRPMKLEELNKISILFFVSLDYLLNLTNNPISCNNKNNINYRFLRYSLKFVRKINRITQKDIGDCFKISAASVNKYENYPKRANITYLYLFAKKFNISIDYLCGKTLKKEVL